MGFWFPHSHHRSRIQWESTHVNPESVTLSGVRTKWTQWDPIAENVCSLQLAYITEAIWQSLRCAIAVRINGSDASILTALEERKVSLVN